MINHIPGTSIEMVHVLGTGRLGKKGKQNIV